MTIANPTPKMAGFTILELVVVMLLITIILGVAIPRFQTDVLQDPSKKLSRWMISTVKNLRGLAIQKQVRQTLVVDFDGNRLWTTGEDMSEEALAAAPENAYTLPDDLRIVDVLFPDEERTSSGTVDINFYPAGFSDQVVIRLENSQAERFSYLIEPLLPKIKIFEEWISF